MWENSLICKILIIVFVLFNKSYFSVRILDEMEKCSLQVFNHQHNYIEQRGKMLSPLHEHPLEQVNPMEVYRPYGGRWKCDNCNSESGGMNPFPFHCRLCSFDLCYSCMNIQHQASNLIHQHQLYYMETSRLCYQNQGGIWRCDVCKKTSDALRETFSYHCPNCEDFDVCRSCYEPKRHPIHIHELKVVDTSLIYSQTGGNWFCDICGTTSRPYEK